MTGKREGIRLLCKSLLLASLGVFAFSGCGPSGVNLANVFTPTLTLSPTVTASATLTATATETFTPIPDTPTATASVTASQTASVTNTATSTNTVTPGPSPTVTLTPSLTRTFTATYIPSLTRTPSRTPTNTFTPTITLTPTPPPSVPFIANPGLLSRMVSPIKAEIYAYPGDDGMVRLELIGEDGRLIARQVLDFTSYKHQSIAFYPTIPFEINSAAETARLQVISGDRFGRTISLMSVDVLLLKAGRNEIFGPAITQEPYILRAPEDGQTISGGKLTIDGLIRPVNASPVILEAIGEDNAVIFTKQFNVAAPSGPLSHTPFQLDVAYKVSAPTPVRLILRQEGSRIAGTVALSSIKVILEP